MLIYFRYLIIIIAAEAFIPQSSARITDSYVNHQAQIKNNEHTNPEKLSQHVQHDDDFEEENLDNLHDENNEHLYYSSQSTSPSNEELDYQDGEKSHISSTSHANKDWQQANDLSEHKYHSTQTVSSSNQELNHYPKVEKESNHISYLHHVNDESNSEYDVSNQDTSSLIHTENKKDHVINTKIQHKTFSSSPLVADNPNTIKVNKNLLYTKNKNDINPKSHHKQFVTNHLKVKFNAGIKKGNEKHTYTENKNDHIVNPKFNNKKTVTNTLNVKDNDDIGKGNEKHFYTENKNDHIINPKNYHKQTANSPLVVDNNNNKGKRKMKDFEIMQNVEFEDVDLDYLAQSETYIEDEEIENEDQSETYKDDVEFDNEDKEYLAQSETSKSREPPTISECADSFRSTFSNTFKKPSTLSRATRGAERKTRSIIDHIMPYAVISSTFMQALSFIGPVISLLANGALSIVDMAGYGISTAGTGMAIGAGLVSKTGELVQRASVAGPGIGAGVVAGGVALLVFSPYIFDIFSSLMVTLGLKMASGLAYSAKSFVKSGSTMDTVFEMGAVFAENLLEDYHGY